MSTLDLSALGGAPPLAGGPMPLPPATPAPSSGGSGGTFSSDLTKAAAIIHKAIQDADDPEDSAALAKCLVEIKKLKAKEAGEIGGLQKLTPIQKGIMARATAAKGNSGPSY